MCSLCEEYQRNHMTPGPKFGKKHFALRKCPHCKVAGYITEKTLIRALLRGLESQNFKIVSVAATKAEEGTVERMIRPLMEVLRDKGMVVR